MCFVCFLAKQHTVLKAMHFHHFHHYQVVQKHYSGEVGK